ncbi:MAG: hypothetical protein QME48_08675 [bacterium]|nr:hypothetical protein [bacterium]
MNKKELKNLVDKIVKEKYEEYSEIKPSIKEIKTETATLQKKLKIKIKPIERKLYSFVYLLDKKPFKKILKITVDENGNIKKIVESK